MEPIKKHTGIAAPLDRANVDTDAIIPKQFLRKTERHGFGQHLFHEWRYLDFEGTRENADFVLNQAAFRSATILLARDNFGCGSSREHAPWALSDFGFRAIIAPSFADIFYSNALKNGILLIQLSPEIMQRLFQQVQSSPGTKLTVDLENQKVGTPDGSLYPFDIHPFARHCLLNGLDQIDWTLQYQAQITAYEQKIQSEQPWLA